jgi:hypothetical protein
MRLVGDAEGDELGTGVVGVGDVDGDGGDDLLIAAPNGLLGMGVVHLVTSGWEDGQAAGEAANTTWVGAVQDGRFGRCVALAHDTSGDSLPDLAICASDQSAAAGDGALHLVPFDVGPFEGDTAVVLYGAFGDDFAASLAAPGDVDGNGIADLWVGAPGWGERDATGAA